MSKEPIIYLKHILDECEFILSVISTDTTKENLLEDEIMKRAIVRSLEIIGEASKKNPVNFKLKWNTIHYYGFILLFFSCRNNYFHIFQKNRLVIVC